MPPPGELTNLPGRCAWRAISLLLLAVPSSGRAAASSVLISPANGSTVAPQQVNFTWTSVPGATEYTLWVGTTPLSDNAVYFGTSQTGNPAGTTSTTASLVAGTTYYVTMWTDVSGSWTYTTSSFQTAATAYLLAPASGATVSPLNTQISWSSVPGASSYTLWLGTTPGTNNALNTTTTGTSTTVDLQPGTTYYTTLWTNVSGNSSSTTSAFTTNATSYITAPAAGAAVSPASVQIAWTSAPTATAYTLWIGTSPGARDALYYAAGTSTGKTINLQPGTNYYATLWTNNNGTWTNTSSSFSTTPAAYITAPSGGVTVSPMDTQISWSSVPGVLSYTLWLGTTPGANNALNTTTTATSTTVDLQPSTTYYATLWTNVSGSSLSTASTFITNSTSYITAPAAGAAVSPASVQITWTSSAGASAYTLWIGTSPGARDALYYAAGTSTSKTINLQPGTRYFATLWTNTNGMWTDTSSSFSTTPVASLTSPAPGATVSPVQTQIAWSSVTGASSYTLWLGSTPGASDGLNSTTTANSATVNLQPGTVYYATLWTNVSGNRFSSVSSFQTASTAYLIQPVQSSITSPEVSFAWQPSPSATGYTLWVGTKPGARDALYYATTGSTASALLLPGTTYYSTLWTNTNGAWTSSTSSFQTAQFAVITSPANGQKNLDAGAPVPVTWTAIPGVTLYQLDVGSSAGGSDVYSTGQTTSTSASVTLQPNTTYYARVWTNTAGTLTYTDSVFNTGNALAHLSYPQNGATNVSAFLPFTWNAPPNATKYQLIVSPTGFGVTDFFMSAGSGLIPTDTSQYVYALEPNTTYYARLCTNFSNGSACTYSTFTIGPAPALPSDRNAFYNFIAQSTGQVRQMASLRPIPLPGTLLEQQILSYGGTPSLGAHCGNFSAVLANLLTQDGILARLRTLSLDGVEGHVVVEYWDPFNQKWQAADPTFAIMFFDPATQTGQGVEDVSALVVNDELPSLEITYVTTSESQYLMAYYLDPITFYVNPQPFGLINEQAQYNWVPNSPLPFLTSVPLDSIMGVSGAYVFNFAQPTDTLTVQDQGTTLIFSPVNTQGWYAPTTLHTGWTVVPPVPAGMTQYTHPRILNPSQPPLSNAPVDTGSD